MNDRIPTFTLTLILTAFFSWIILLTTDFYIFPTVISSFGVSAIFCEVVYSYKKENYYKIEKNLILEEEKRKNIIEIYGLVDDLISKNRVVFQNKSSADLVDEVECFRLIQKIHAQYNQARGSV